MLLCAFFGLRVEIILSRDKGVPGFPCRAIFGGVKKYWFFGEIFIPVGQESSSASANKNLFGSEDVGGFGSNFGADDTCDTKQSFSFFGGGDCKSPEEGEKEGEFFLNFGGGGDVKMEEESGWNLFGQ